jgi:serine/threonine protein kinase
MRRGGKYALMPGLEGRTLGHHHLKHLLGRGGMAEVYLARDEHLFRDVAIKVVHTSRMDHFARFQREAEIIGPLAHDHILPVFEYGEQGDWHYLVMPYAAHGTLADLLRKKGALSPQEAGMLLEQIASALQFAHERGILHRDIKPSNILLRDESYAYLADFGIAKSQDERSGLTQVGTVIGTPEYMAPELLEGPASPSSDIYALGIVLYQMLTGKVPFEGKTALAVLQKHAHEPPVRPSLVNPTILPAIEQVVLKAIEKDPDRRFRTPEALAEAYRQALQGSNANQETVIASPLILRPPVGTQAPSNSQATAQTPLQAGLSVPPYTSQPRRKSLMTGLLVGIGVIALLLVLVFLLPNLLGNYTNNQSQGHTPAQSPTITAPTSTPTRVANACHDQRQVTINDTANVLDSTQICDAISTWPYALTIYTTNISSEVGNLTDKAKSLLTDANTIVMAIGVDNSRGHSQSHIAIVHGSSVQISDTQYSRAREAFSRQANAGNYTRPTIAAIEALQAPDQKQKQEGKD